MENPSSDVPFVSSSWRCVRSVVYTTRVRASVPAQLCTRRACRRSRTSWVRWWIYLSRGLPECTDRDREYSVIAENTFLMRPDVAEDLDSKSTVTNQYPRTSIFSDANVRYLLATSEFCASRVVCSLLPALLNFCNLETILSDRFFITRELIT
jgi:hypothetical protein